MAEQIQQRHPEKITEAGFLELSEPSIAEAVKRLYERGVRDVLAAQAFLFAGVHVRLDIPLLLAKSMEQYDGLRIRMASYVGVCDNLVKLGCKRIAEAEEEAPAYDAVVVDLSRDPDALAGLAGHLEDGLLAGVPVVALGPADSFETMARALELVGQSELHAIQVGVTTTLLPLYIPIGLGFSYRKAIAGRNVIVLEDYWQFSVTGLVPIEPFLTFESEEE